MADTSIYSRFMPPERSMQDYLDEADARDQRGMQNKLNTMMLQDKQRVFEEQNQLRALYAQPDFDPSTPEAVNRVMRVSPTAGFTMQKNLLDTQKARGEMAKIDAETQAKTLGMANDRYKAWQTTMGALAQQPNLTKDMALQTGQQLVQMGIMTPQMFQGAAAKLPDDPAQLRQQILTGLKTQLTPEQMLTIFAPKADKVDDGQTISYRDTNPNSSTYGKTTGGLPVPKLQSRESIASQATQRRGQDMTDARARDRNNIDAGADAPQAPNLLGVPVPAVMPWANQSNPKDANKVKANEQTRGSKEVEKDIDFAKKEGDAAAAAKRFIELNKKTTTGGLVDRIGVTRGVQSLGSDYAEMEAITAKLAPSMRAEGSGSTSDFDGKQFERATVGVDKPAATNENIAKGVIARAQNSQEYADFRQTYLEQNGTLQGADRFWKDYSNKNPIFDPNKEGTFQLNPSRKTWKEHFKGGEPAASGAGLTAAEAAELADLRKRLGK